MRVAPVEGQSGRCEVLRESARRRCLEEGCERFPDDAVVVSAANGCGVEKGRQVFGVGGRQGEPTQGDLQGKKPEPVQILELLSWVLVLDHVSVHVGGTGAVSPLHDLFGLAASVVCQEQGGCSCPDVLADAGCAVVALRTGSSPPRLSLGLAISASSAMT